MAHESRMTRCALEYMDIKQYAKYFEYSNTSKLSPVCQQPNTCRRTHLKFAVVNRLSSWHNVKMAEQLRCQVHKDYTSSRHVSCRPDNLARHFTSDPGPASSLPLLYLVLWKIVKVTRENNGRARQSTPRIAE